MLDWLRSLFCRHREHSYTMFICSDYAVRTVRCERCWKLLKEEVETSSSASDED